MHSHFSSSITDDKDCSFYLDQSLCLPWIFLTKMLVVATLREGPNVVSGKLVAVRYARAIVDSSHTQGGEEYLCFPHYCACEDFAFTVMTKKDIYVCASTITALRCLLLVQTPTRCLAWNFAQQMRGARVGGPAIRFIISERLSSSLLCLVY
jgi:hypothetical protein